MNTKLNNLFPFHEEGSSNLLGENNVVNKGEKTMKQLGFLERLIIKLFIKNSNIYLDKMKEILENIKKNNQPYLK